MFIHKFYQVINVIVDKLKYGAINNKKILIFLLTLGIIGIIIGSIFMTILSESDKTIIISYITNYIEKIISGNINYVDNIKNSIFSNIGYVIFIWLLGISIIGLPLVVIFYFFKIFTLGFSISSFILTYKVKGLIPALIYLFPSEIIMFFTYVLLTLYSIKISKNLIYSYLKKENNNINIKNKYLKVLIVCTTAMIICSLYEVFIMPFLIQKLSFLIK